MNKINALQRLTAVNSVVGDNGQELGLGINTPSASQKLTAVNSTVGSRETAR